MSFHWLFKCWNIQHRDPASVSTTRCYIHQSSKNLTLYFKVILNGLFQNSSMYFIKCILYFGKVLMLMLLCRLLAHITNYWYFALCNACPPIIVYAVVSGVHWIFPSPHHVCRGDKLPGSLEVTAREAFVWKMTGVSCRGVQEVKQLLRSHSWIMRLEIME